MGPWWNFLLGLWDKKTCLFCLYGSKTGLDRNVFIFTLVTLHLLSAPVGLVRCSRAKEINSKMKKTTLKQMTPVVMALHLLYTMRKGRVWTWGTNRIPQTTIATRGNASTSLPHLAQNATFLPAQLTGTVWGDRDSPCSHRCCSDGCHVGWRRAESGYNLAAPGLSLGSPWCWGRWQRGSSL